jgi:hypothetical protein
MPFDKSVEDQILILMTIHNLINQSAWYDEINLKLIEESLDNDFTHYQTPLHKYLRFSSLLDVYLFFSF